jgi:hypothetical protein
MTEMGEIDHTNPFVDDPFVQTYSRGQIVAADGGEPGTDPGTESGSGAADTGGDGDDREENDDEETMEDVPHTSPNEGANRTFERGTEGRDGSV